MISELTAAQVAARLEATPAPQLIDVREPWEWDVARLPGARLVPLATLPGALAGLEPALETIVYCHHGVRSMHACRFLAQAGFVHLANLAGGIDAWSAQVDSAVARY